MGDDVRDFVERDKALCSQALNGDRELIARAAEMIDSAVKHGKRAGIPLDDDSDLT